MRKHNPTARYDDDLNNWVYMEDNIFIVGLTDFSQAFLGEVASVEDLPQKGQLLAKGAIYGVVESSKATTELYAPVGGKVVATNAQLLKNPNLINEDCYGEGWVLKLTDTAKMDWEDLLTAEEYMTEVRSFFNK